ncbi:hypothetical protein RA989_21430, partial [Mycobacteroides abscessus subsp. massiliense]
MALTELLTDSRRYRPVEPDYDVQELDDVAATILSSLDERTKLEISERAGNIRELLTGYRLGSPETAGAPRWSSAWAGWP